ncbi:ABC transporter ATP-binding protein [Leucobacter sp. M11]|uniref:ABC transporter ATP-binding protein n=1 Tax=Leucobacter sp. M11 TaxID=2993565 RepID=UPI002D7E36DF|nr:ABC transporter ATP-binding protein [Leucobacter sp. M11]MEB4616053.1 ABC transporter ATP-binding protein [Leucobacter sp. M11]
MTAPLPAPNALPAASPDAQPGAQPTELLSIAELTVRFPGQDRPAVSGLSLSVRPGEIVALVGESGSGKTLTARAALGLLPAGARQEGGALRLLGDPAPAPGQAAWRLHRGRVIGLVQQDPMTALDPLRTLLAEVGDPVRLHGSATRRERAARVTEALADAGIPDAAERLRSRPDQLSGGQRQRALIASALILDPQLIIADEPTTALDSALRGRVLGLLTERVRAGAGMLLVSHDLASVAEVADRVLVMRAGAVVEQGTPDEVLRAPRERYTRELIAAVPWDRPRGEPLLPEAAPRVPAAPPLPGGAPRVLDSGPVLSATDVTVRYGRGAQARTAVDGVSLELVPGETLGLVGASGSGKSSLLGALLALRRPQAGSVRLFGEPWHDLPERRRAPLRHRIALVPQDPLGSFDPRLTGAGVLADALRAAHRAGGPRPSRAAAAALAERVGLDPALLRRSPGRLSGGQRQRLAIARALAGSPRILLLDEPVSALDATVQARVLDLLDGIQRETGAAFLLVSHDLGVIRHMSDRVAVLDAGRIVDEGDALDVIDRSEHPVTAGLRAAAPRLAAG